MRLSEHMLPPPSSQTADIRTSDRRCRLTPPKGQAAEIAIEREQDASRTPREIEHGGVRNP
jgi:hypothetical protein